MRERFVAFWFHVSVVIRSVYMDGVVSGLSLARESLHDFEFGDVSIGASLIVAGVMVVALAETPPGKKESPGVTVMRLGGSLLSCFGFYRLVKGVFEDYEGCGVRLRLANDLLLTCTATQGLWNRTIGDGSLSLRCANLEEAENKAMVWHGTHKRYIFDTPELVFSRANREIVSDLLFELIRKVRMGEAKPISQNKCRLGRDAYAIAMESIEYEMAKDTYTMSSRCIADGIWPKGSMQFRKQFEGKSGADWSSVLGYLKFQQDSGHTDQYRKVWDEACSVK